MPYIQMRAYPKDEAVKKRVAERFKQVLVEEWGCPESAVSVSIEEVPPERWEEDVVEPIIDKKADVLFIRDGKAVRRS